jgi:hypothetical protein
MAGRMQVTAFMGVITALGTPGGRSPTNVWSSFGNPGPLCVSNLMSHQVFFSLTGTSLSIAIAWPQCLAFFGTPLLIEPSPGELPGDAGLLPIH